MYNVKTLFALTVLANATKASSHQSLLSLMNPQTYQLVLIGQVHHEFDSRAFEMQSFVDIRH